MTKIVIVNTYTVAAGGKQTVSVYRVSAAKTFTLKRVAVHFPPGTEHYLKVAVMYGIKNVCPGNGYFQGEDTVLESFTEQKYEPDSTVDIYMENTDTTNSHTFTIIIEGEEE